MPKERWKLSKKHEFLIDQISEIPTINEILHPFLDGGISIGMCQDHRYNTENIILMALETLTKGTQMEDIGKELSDKAREVFDYYAEKQE